MQIAPSLILRFLFLGAIGWKVDYIGFVGPSKMARNGNEGFNRNVEQTKVNFAFPSTTVRISSNTLSFRSKSISLLCALSLCCRNVSLAYKRTYLACLVFSTFTSCVVQLACSFACVTRAASLFPHSPSSHPFLRARGQQARTVCR